MATQSSLNVEATLPVPVHGENANVSGSVAQNGLPSVVVLESGIKALVKISRLAYIDGVPVAIAGAGAEDIDPGDWVEVGPNGIKLRTDAAPIW